MYPTQWIETDKNAHKRREGGEAIEPYLKGRLVSCGQFEDTQGLMSDSPTIESEGVNVSIIYAACNQLKLKVADVRNAYFQGEPLGQVLLLAPPRGGLRGEDTHGAAILARVPIYGTRDGGRRFGRKLRKAIAHADMETAAGVKST